MTPRPCPTHLTCQEGDFPIINYSAEDPDPFTFLGIAFGKSYCRNYLTFQWPAGSSLHYCFSPNSQADANACAAIAANQDCSETWNQGSFGNPQTRVPGPGDIGGGHNPGIRNDSPTPGPDSPPFPSNPPISDDPTDPGIVGNPPELFFNGTQSCTACCQGGPCASYTTRAGMFPGSTQAESDLWGAVYACRQAILQLPGGCRPPLPTYPPPVRLPGGKTLPPKFWNDPQSCTSTCADGSSNSFTTPAGRFTGSTQAAANTAAKNFACAQARINRLCFSDITGTICVGQLSSKTATVTSVKPVAFALIGSLPPGMVLNVDDHNATIIGIPTVPGNYTFSLDATDGVNTINKSFTIEVLGLTNSPPNGSVGTGYSFQFTASGGTPPYTFAVTNGTLPFGLSMSLAGLITGTPTAAQTESFQVTVTDSGP